MTAPRRSGAGRAGSAPSPAAGRAPGRRGAGRAAARGSGAGASAAAIDAGPAADEAVEEAAAREAVGAPDLVVPVPSRRQPARPRTRTRDGGGHNRLTGRATALFVVVAMLAVAYTWPVKEYLRQHSELARLQAQSAATQARVDALQAQKTRWADPAYVEAQARQRLHFVQPGETAYVVLQPGRPAQPQTLPKQTAQVLPAWYTELWDSVQGADQPTTR